MEAERELRSKASVVAIKDVKDSIPIFNCWVL